MLDRKRLAEMMSDRGLSQSELARRVGVAQASIYKLVSGKVYGSRHLHRIARELGTTPAYLTGETDDPHADAPAISDLSSEQRDLVDDFAALDRADRRAFSHIVRSLARSATPAPELPAPEELTAMFRAMLEALPPEATWDEQAAKLAEWLPFSLQRVRAVQARNRQGRTMAEVLALHDNVSPS